MASFTNEFLPELGESEFGPLGEGAYEGLFEADGEIPPGMAEAAARAALDAVAAEFEGESELNPVRRWYPDAMLEHLAHTAAEAETEDQAGEAFLPLIPLVASKLLPLAAKAAPLIAKALPKVMSVVSRVTPQLTRGVTNVARTIFRTPTARRFLRTIPTIAQRTVGQIARQVAAGQPITARGAVQALARQTANILRQPSRVRRAVARSGAIDRRLHQAFPGAGGAGSAAAGPVAGVPTAGPRPPGRGCVCGGCSCGG